MHYNSSSINPSFIKVKMFCFCFRDEHLSLLFIQQHHKLQPLKWFLPHLIFSSCFAKQILKIMKLYNLPWLLFTHHYCNISFMCQVFKDSGKTPGRLWEGFHNVIIFTSLCFRKWFVACLLTDSYMSLQYNIMVFLEFISNCKWSEV